MIKKLLTRKRIQTLKQAEDWKSAIRIASEPLLAEKVIDIEYVDAMIDAVEEYGPYIVLADEFALPHASKRGGVKELAMSLLVLEEAVDMLGKPVKVLLVLAAVDNQSHLEALAALTEIVSDDNKFNIIKKGNIDEIIKIIKEV